MGYTLTDASRMKMQSKAKLADLQAHYQREKAVLMDRIAAASSVLSAASSGLDYEKIITAGHIITVSDYGKGGKERDEVIRDAIDQFANGKPVKSDLWQVYFGTKNYDRWTDQRNDGPYGTCPRHGYIAFRIEVRSDIRKKPQDDLLPQEVEAVIYYLTHLQAIQENRKESDIAAKMEAG